MIFLNLLPSDIEDLRHQYYNATVHGIHLVHENLMILRVQPDQGLPSFRPGQFTILGLGTWEPCITESLSAPTYSDPLVLIKRAYSISCSMLDSSGNLVRPTETPYLEFYIARIGQSDFTKPVLTPRLFGLKEGARLFCGEEPRGHYVLPALADTAKVVFAATGTGEAPHNAMLAELLSNNYRGKIVLITCVRQKKDLAYAEVHHELERRYPDYRYLALTTREPENVDSTNPTFVGKRYLQDYFRSGNFEQDTQLKLSPTDTHVFLCGSPGMIGSAHTGTTTKSQSVELPGMVDVLEQRGFRLDGSSSSGNIHTERYW